MTPEQIAAELTEAQKQLLKKLPETGLVASNYWNQHKPTRTLQALFRKRLSGLFGEITPLGLKVRAILEGKSNA